MRLAMLGLGAVLILAGLISGYFWFYRLVPIRHLADPHWLSMHSEKARWDEEQKNYRRTNDSPDTFFCGDRIGRYGDKTWVSWLIGNIEKGDGFRVCGCTMGVLADMTNQDFHDPADWLDWYKQHKEESQEQWIQQGFDKYGVVVHLPPVDEDEEALLTLLGNNEKDEDGVRKIPSAIRYNAFRWLRDSGFDLDNYIASNRDWHSSEQLALGVCRYARLSAWYQWELGLGILAFAKKPDSEQLSPRISSPTTKVVANAIVFGSMFLGVVFVWFSARKRKQVRRDATDN